MPGVKKTLPSRPVEAETLLESVRREVIPVLEETRRAVNVMGGDRSTITSDYTAKLSDRFLFVDATDGEVTVTLPLAAVADDYEFTVKKIDSSGNAVNIASSSNIDGSTPLVLLAQYDVATVLAYNETYYVTSMA